MRRWKVYTRNFGERYQYEAKRFWTRAAAEHWAVAHQDRLLALWHIGTERNEES